ncbi:hypothetical protein ACLOJK_011937 [Asimina triloba]
MAVSAPPYCQHCRMEGLYGSMSSGTVTGSVRSPFDVRAAPDFSSVRNPLLGVQSHWLSMGQEIPSSKVRVASNYSDPVPESSNYMGNRGYHPLEELKDCERSRDKMLTGAEIARTTVEANSSALLVFPGMVHTEPHERTSWAEFQYVIDDFGDIFFEIFDDENMLLDRGARNPVTVLIGMDLQSHGNYNDRADGRSHDDASFDDDNKEIGDTEVSSMLIDWGLPDTLRQIHPTYFAKCLTKALHTECLKKMDHPSNGLSIAGCIRPAFIDEESYLRTLFHGEDSDGYDAEFEDGTILDFNPKDYGGSLSSALYKLEIMKIKLFSGLILVAPVRAGRLQAMISLQDFQEAESDVLMHSASDIIKRFSGSSLDCDTALRTLCRKKKGLIVEATIKSGEWGDFHGPASTTDTKLDAESNRRMGANLIGVDSLGMDVRVFTGLEARTIRFSFNARSTPQVNTLYVTF